MAHLTTTNPAEATILNEVDRFRHFLNSPIKASNAKKSREYSTVKEFCQHEIPMGFPDMGIPGLEVGPELMWEYLENMVADGEIPELGWLQADLFAFAKAIRRLCECYESSREGEAA